MNLIKTSVWSACATVIKIMIGFVLNKILAIYVGPSGVALLGQFSNYTTMATTIGNAGINSGVTKYIAEYNGDQEKQKRIVNTSLSMAFYSSILFGFANYFFAKEISKYLFNSLEYSIILKVFALTLIFTSINSTVLSILNGYKKIKLLIIVGVLNNLIGLVMAYVLVTKYQIFGALFSVVLTQSVVCITTILIIRRFEWFEFSFIMPCFDKTVVAKLSQYTIMTIISASAVASSQIIIRNYLAEYLSLDEAGYWQGVWKISEVYLLITLTSLSTYYLPRIAELTDAKEIKREVLYSYKIILPITIIMASTIYFLRDYIIPILFTEKFMPMRELFLFQLTGDVFRIASWLLGAFMIAKTMTRLFIITEVAFSISFIILTCLFTNLFGLVGITYAYAMNYLMHLFVMIVFIGRKVFSGKLL